MELNVVITKKQLDMKNIRLLFILSLINMIPIFSSCNDENEIDEWSDTCVYLEDKDFLIPNRLIGAKHTPGGIDDVSVHYFLKVQKVSSQDIIIRLEFEGENIPEENLIVNNEVVIPAGSLSSEEQVAKIDWSFAAEEEARRDCKLVIKIQAIQANEDTQISQLRKEFSVIILKEAYCSIFSEKPDRWKEISRANWQVEASSVYDNYTADLAIDGSTGWNSWLVDNKNGQEWWKTLLDIPNKIVGLAIVRQGKWGYDNDASTVKLQYKKQGEVEWIDCENMTFEGFKKYRYNPQYSYLQKPIENVKEFKIVILAPLKQTGLGEFYLYTE